MRRTIVMLSAVWILGCNQKESKKNSGPLDPESKDSINAIPKEVTDTVAIRSTDTLLLDLSNKILALLKKKDFATFSSFVHPVWGLRFSPYAFIDTLHHQRLSPDELVTLSLQKKKLLWGVQDGSGEPIEKTLIDYVNRFVYDEDFMAAPQISFNKILGTGNSLNNLKTIYPTAAFTEFHFPGFDPKFGGMDWKSLRLVFRLDNNTPWLIAIIHDEWTI